MLDTNSQPHVKAFKIKGFTQTAHTLSNLAGIYFTVSNLSV